MYLVDANILVYSTDSNAKQHEQARDWLDENLAGQPGYVALPWPSLLAYLRLVTNPRIYSPPATISDAWDRVEEWLGRPAAWIPAPGDRHRLILGRLLAAARPSGNLIPDVHLAALAAEHGLTVVSTDTDFARFPEVPWLDPVNPRR
jgi:toxin-antitoxin system PIN domain toxin